MSNWKARVGLVVAGIATVVLAAEPPAPQINYGGAGPLISFIAPTLANTILAEMCVALFAGAWFLFCIADRKE